MKTCSVEGCNEKHQANGLCKKCYHKQYFQDNKEKELKRMKKWQRDNREHMLKQRKQYNQDHKEERKQAISQGQ